MTNPCRHWFTSESYDCWNRYCSSGGNSLATILKRQGDISFGPQTLDGFRLDSCLAMPVVAVIYR